MEKESKYFEIDINIEWTHYLTAKNKKEAIEEVKNSFYEEYGIEIDPEKEITRISEKMEV